MPKEDNISREVLGGGKRKKLKCPEWKSKFKKGKPVKLKVDKPKPPEKDDDNGNGGGNGKKKFTLPAFS